jgi:hypothetical protein
MTFLAFSFEVIPQSLGARGLSEPEAAIRNPHSALEWPNFFMDDTALFFHLSRVKG